MRAFHFPSVNVDIQIVWWWKRVSKFFSQISVHEKQKEHYKLGVCLPEVHVVAWIRARTSKESWGTFFLLLMCPVFQVSIP